MTSSAQGGDNLRMFFFSVPAILFIIQNNFCFPWSFLGFHVYTNNFFFFADLTDSVHAFGEISSRLEKRSDDKKKQNEKRPIDLPPPRCNVTKIKRK